jgi:hypothetical protein
MSDTATVRVVPRSVGEQSGSKESRNERFRRLATTRTLEALKRLDRIGDLASPKPAYSEEEARKILDALRERVDAVERRLLQSNTGFTFE